MIVKVCGMRYAENIREIENTGIDWMGFIFWNGTKRFVDSVPQYLPNIKRVGVFVNATIQDIMNHITVYNLNIIQLHGNENPAFIQELRDATNNNVQIIKSLNIADEQDVEKTKEYEGFADYFLFDTKSKMIGGNGTQFKWNTLHKYNGCTPFILSGGIGPNDAEKVKAFKHPQLAGIDINSKFEITPALKDKNIILKFINEIRL